MFYVFLKSLGILAATVVGLLALGLGIVKAIDYVEDKAYAAKRHIETIIQISAGLHIILLLRGVSFFQILFSLTVQYAFYCLLDIYPLVKMDNPYFIYGTIASLLNHFLVIRLIFSRNAIYGMEIVFYFALIWITPFCFFLSLSANDEVLFAKGKKTAPNTLIGSLLKKYLHRASPQDARGDL